jgi:serine/threonine-protein kinase RsbW
MKDNFKFIVPGKPEYVGAVRLAISSLANNVGFDIESIEDIKVAVSEACTNIVTHGEDDMENEYKVNCEICNDKLSISVEDNAGGYDTSSYKEPTLPADEAGGLGIFIIKALMDEVEVESKVGVGTQIRMVKYIQEM